MKTKFKHLAVILTMGGVIFSSSVIAQNPQLNSKIDPLHSNGYMYWDDISTGDYLVEIEQEDINGILTPIKSFIIKDNWFKLDKEILNLPNAHITINTYENGVTTDYGDAIITVPPGHLPDSLLCSAICNGTNTSYAYKLNLWEDGNTGVRRMQFSGATNYYDPTTQEYVPFYQPISQSVWNQIASIPFPFHPYARPTGTQGIFAYKKIQITSSNPNTYFDVMNNPVTDGYLVEKKTDEFRIFRGVSTTAEPSTNLCSLPVNTSATWVDFFQLYHDETQVFPTNYSDTLYFGNPDELTCAQSTYTEGSSPFTNGIAGDNHGVLDNLDIWGGCVTEAGSFAELVGCHEEFFNNQIIEDLGINGKQIVASIT